MGHVGGRRMLASIYKERERNVSFTDPTLATARTFIQGSREMTALRPSSSAFQVHQQGAGWEVEPAPFHLAPNRKQLYSLLQGTGPVDL